MQRPRNADAEFHFHAAGSHTRYPSDPWSQGGGATPQSRSGRQCWPFHFRRLRFRAAPAGGLKDFACPLRTTVKLAHKDPSSSNQSAADARAAQFHFSTFSRDAKIL